MIKTKFTVVEINSRAKYKGTTYTYSTKIRGDNNKEITVFDPVVSCSQDLEENEKYEGILTGLVLTNFEGGYCRKRSECSHIERNAESGLKICGEVLGTEKMHDDLIDSEDDFVPVKCDDFVFNIKKENLISEGEFNKIKKGDYLEINYIRPDLAGIIKDKVKDE